MKKNSIMTPLVNCPNDHWGTRTCNKTEFSNNLSHTHYSSNQQGEGDGGVKERKELDIKIKHAGMTNVLRNCRESLSVLLNGRSFWKPPTPCTKKGMWNALKIYSRQTLKVAGFIWKSFWEQMCIERRSGWEARTARFIFTTIGLRAPRSAFSKQGLWTSMWSWTGWVMHIFSLCLHGFPPCAPISFQSQAY